MIKRIYKYLLTGAMLVNIVSCMKEKVVDDFQVFGQFKIANSTAYSNLFAKVENVSFQLNSNTYYKLKPGPNQVKISGRGSAPEDTAVAIFDTLLNIEVDKKYDFVLFQPAADIRPKIMVNDQQNEAVPAEGYVKIKIANFARHCFPDDIDLEMIMYDYDYNLIATDTIRSVGFDFLNYGSFRLLGINEAALGFISFTPLNAITKEPIGETFNGLELDNSQTGSWYKVATLFITEELNELGNITGSDGNRYVVEMKTLFLN